MIRIFIKEVTDRILRENFKRIKAFLEVTQRHMDDMDNPHETPSEADRFVDTKILDEDAPALRFVAATSNTNVALGQFNDAAKAVILGMTLEEKKKGEEVRVLFLGQDDNTAYTFLLNALLYLTTDGQASATAPTTGWRTVVAKSHGPGSIFVNPEEPIENQ